MPPDVLVSAGLQYGGKIIDMASQNYRDKRNHRWDVQAATTAYDRQRQLLADQRAYESPAALMRRYIEAGLNPNLIYGQQQGSIAPPTVPQASNSVGTTQTSFGDVNLMQTKLMQAQIDQLDSQTNRTNKLTPFELRLLANQLNVTEAEAARLNQECENLKKQWEKYGKEIDMLNEDIRAKKIENYISENTAGDRIEMIAAELKCSKSKAAKIDDILTSSIAQAFGNAHQAQAAAKRMESMTAAEVRLTNMMAAYYQNLANKTLSEKLLLDLEKELKDYYGDTQIVSEIMSKTTIPGQGLISWLNTYSPEEYKNRRKKGQHPLN